MINRNSRKILYITLSVLLVFILSLTIVYAALNVTLRITGNTEVIASSWDVHFDNIQINAGSISATTTPTITDRKTVDFGVTLKKTGDYYKFTVDVINNGTIDAMIESVVKTPNLTEKQDF